jgi:hypothetical protein
MKKPTKPKLPKKPGARATAATLERWIERVKEKKADYARKLKAWSSEATRKLSARKTIDTITRSGTTVSIRIGKKRRSR